MNLDDAKKRMESARDKARELVKLNLCGCLYTGVGQHTCGTHDRIATAFLSIQKEQADAEVGEQARLINERDIAKKEAEICERLCVELKEVYLFSVEKENTLIREKAELREQLALHQNQITKDPQNCDYCRQEKQISDLKVELTNLRERETALQQDVKGLQGYLTEREKEVAALHKSWQESCTDAFEKTKMIAELLKTLQLVKKELAEIDTPWSNRLVKFIARTKK